MPDGRAQLTYWDTSDSAPSGFGVRVSGKTGRRTFVLRYRSGGRQRRRTLGTYPTVSLSQARNEADNVLARVQLGQEPDPPAGGPGRGFKKVAESYLESARGNRITDDHADSIGRAFKKDVYPALGSVPISEIGRRDIAEVLDKVVARGSPVMANRLKSMISQVFEHAYDRELVDGNPARQLRQPAKESGRDRVLTRREIRQLWDALEGETLIPATVVKMRLLTAQRGAEIRQMEHSDVHGDLWVQRAETTKKRRRHTVPLSPQALDVLASLEPVNADSEYVFPSPRVEGHVRRPEGLLTRLRDALPFSDWQLRDLRRTVATRMADDLQVPRLHIAKILGHKVEGVTSVYDRASYEEEKREALERWGRELEALVADGS